MATNIAYPGVYIEEVGAFPNSVVAVPTAVPAFVGYTEKASIHDKSLNNKPVKVSSLEEYQQYFGKAPEIKYEIKKDPAKEFVLQDIQATKYYLYNALRFFFANGGSTCYIVSVGSYATQVKRDALEFGIRTFQKEPEPTMLVVPDAVLLNAEDCFGIQKAMLKHCGSEMKNRIALLDVFDGYMDRNVKGDNDVIMRFREGVGDSFLQWGAAYYPWLNTTLVPENEINFKKNISNPEGLVKILNNEVDNLFKTGKVDVKKAKLINTELEKIASGNVEVDRLHQTLIAVSTVYKKIINEIKVRLNKLPPSGGIAGVITMVDSNKGVWKAPANVTINQVVSPTVKITNTDQEDLNTPEDGKSINAIRTFPGLGVLIWGARTLQGNENEWQYISVCRTVIMIEQSLKAAIKAYVFESNNANTWFTVQEIASNFLTAQWKQGALAGASANDAFYIRVGLGTTMTQQDLLDGKMRIEIGLAAVRPAEFIVITIEQKMQ